MSVEITGERLLLSNVLITTWDVTALGFIEHEAMDAHDEAVAALMQHLPLIRPVERASAHPLLRMGAISVDELREASACAPS